MIDIIIFVTFSVMAFRIAKSVRNESAIFIEFEQPKIIGWLVLLFPLGPIVYLTLLYRVGWLPSLLLMTICYLPSFLVSKKCISVFDCAGTDGVDKAKDAAMQAYGTSIAGLVYTAVILVINIAFTANA